MNTFNFAELLRGNDYPGRGIVIGRSADGAKAVVLYFIMGRSENSRNRVFERTDDGIRTRAFDEAKLSDPSLVIYHPVRVSGGYTIVTNGDQTDTIRDDFEKTHGGKGAAHGGFRRALKTREFEPDPPIYTPRISAVVEPDGGYTLSILKSADGDASLCYRQYFEYDKPVAGTGHFISTYMNDGNPPPSFSGEPVAVALEYASLNELANTVWDALNADNKVSLFAREIDLATGETNDIIINKHK